MPHFHYLATMIHQISPSNRKLNVVFHGRHVALHATKENNKMNIFRIPIITQNFRTQFSVDLVPLPPHKFKRKSSWYILSTKVRWALTA